MYLEKIEEVNDIKRIDPEHYAALAQEIREFLIEKISVTGGHLGSNLGTVELTMALHLALNLPTDKIIWDVGHQSYTHKILTGRKDGFDVLRQFHGMSGFPKRKESDCDAFDTGHSSTSISAGLGLVMARDFAGAKNTIVSVIGDGSLTGGMAYEALNNAAKLETNFIIVLNDNNMSISENVGGVSKYLNNIRTASGYLDLKKGIYNALLSSEKENQVIRGIRRLKSSLKTLVIPGMFFEDMGITYLGPVDGHDIQAMVSVIRAAQRVEGAVIIHAITKKGKGFAPAEKHPARFHGTEPFDPRTGKPLRPKTKATYTDVFSDTMVMLGEQEEKLVAITAAMPDGTGLKSFGRRFPDRLFDVGIAEEHAVTFAAGLAAGGMKPVVAVYSSFLQRAYDQIIHDVCLQNLPVVFAIDRAGLVGSDGETHQGIFDFTFMSSIPNMHVCAPKNKWELRAMLSFAVAFNGPMAIRYPRGEAYGGLEEYQQPIVLGKAEWIYREDEIVLLSIGSMVEEAVRVRDILKSEGHGVSLVNMRFLKPLDEEMIREAAKSHSLLVTMEENIAVGGLGAAVLSFAEREGIPNRILQITLPDSYVEHGSVQVLKEMLRVDPAGIADRIREALRG